MRKLMPVLMICAAIALFVASPALAEEEPTSAELKDESKRGEDQRGRRGNPAEALRRERQRQEPV